MFTLLPVEFTFVYVFYFEHWHHNNAQKLLIFHESHAHIPCTVHLGPYPGPDWVFSFFFQISEWIVGVYEGEYMCGHVSE